MDYNSTNIDQQLIIAYQNAIYSVEHPPLELRIGQINEGLNVFCFDNNIYSWAFISAWNPRSKPLSDAENATRHEQLVAKVSAMGLRSCEGKGIDPKGAWSPEASLFILDIDKAAAIELAQGFEQHAIVFGVFNQVPELVFCLGR